MINIIASVSNNNIIGQNNEIPWVITEDLVHFNRLTIKNVVVMGWNTWRAFGEKPLPGRTNYVISRKNKRVPRGVHLVSDPFSIVEKEKGKEIFIIGGASLFASFIPLADKIYLTKVNLNVRGGSLTRMPVIPYAQFKTVFGQKILTKAGIHISFCELTRRK